MYSFIICDFPSFCKNNLCNLTYFFQNPPPPVRKITKNASSRSRSIAGQPAPNPPIRSTNLQETFCERTASPICHYEERSDVVIRSPFRRKAAAKPPRRRRLQAKPEVGWITAVRIRINLFVIPLLPAGPDSSCNCEQDNHLKRKSFNKYIIYHIKY